MHSNDSIACIPEVDGQRILERRNDIPTLSMTLKIRLLQE
jgi:hypothetical protein